MRDVKCFQHPPALYNQWPAARQPTQGKPLPIAFRIAFQRARYQPILDGQIRLALGAKPLTGTGVYEDPAVHPFCLVPRPSWTRPIA